MESNALMWFRKGLRIHDNPALDHACRGSKRLFPVFVLDPRYLDPDPSAFSPGSAFAGLNRIQFLLESLADLDSSLKKLGSRLLVLKGDPVHVLCRILKDWDIGKLCFEFDTEPYSLARDNKVKVNRGKPPLTYQSFVALAGEPPTPLTHTYSVLPPIGDLRGYEVLNIPTIQELGYGDVKQEKFSPFRGGESEALERLKKSIDDKEWVANFEKPKGDPSAFLKPATTILSPYLKFGCLSSRYFYHCLIEVYRTSKKHTSPPVSLVGQLLWREFFYTAAFGTPNFDKMRGNKICKQIPWRDDEELFAAWREGRTGYPWIDAIMIQFLHWEKGRDVFERLLIDSDWAINNGNWLWLSCSSFFYQYHRIYSPISFGRKYDPTGKYIRHFLPVLKNMPNEYIYEPWTAPLSIQKKANCIIGIDYPRPVVDHSSASKECRRLMGVAYGSKPSAEENLNISRRKPEGDDQKEHQQNASKQRRKLI
ncbi:uncharacterized protein A4U43_C06F9060 [Asparagus officinalis]|uniref:Photolyase/cryptochrome alpha/beta domain-containing protein n=1 Tax=Asparagus officinalis TaxID=4686 RepID=A0A5P1EPN3_ASPOF|nr:uncharacterized protein A4U43_C06F9060 [Asparagus officinalis]